MKTICLDAGNSQIKIALIENNAILSLASFMAADYDGLLQYVKSMPQVEASIMSSVSAVNQIIVDEMLKKTTRFMELSAQTPVPIRNLYKTPETLGKDRLAAVVGAHSLFPKKDILVFDAGTALTIDFIDKDGNYHGGNISPGLKMRFRALHDYTQKLFLCSQTDDFQLIGNSTSSAIVSGVQFGMIFEIENYIKQFEKKKTNLVKIFTGGDAFFFADKIKSRIFAEPNLVLIGLNCIINFNLKKTWY